MFSSFIPINIFGKKNNYLTCGLNFSDDTRNSWGRKNTILTNHQLTNLKNKINNLHVKMIVNTINDCKILDSELHGIDD